MLDFIDELIGFLNGVSEEINVVVMPDFFLDRMITLESSLPEFAASITEVASRKGGSIDGVPQTDIRGGNAVNTASALAALGVNVTPIVCTSQLGMAQLNLHLKPMGIDTSHVKISTKASLTTALEIAKDSGRLNVMLRDLGSLANFGPEDLSEADYSIINDADYVCVFNWAGTKMHGTELASNVFRAVKTSGKGMTYYDTADPTPNRERIPELMENVLKTGVVDVLSVNENEAVTYASFLDEGIHKKMQELGHEELALDSARILARKLSARIDLHTTAFSATVTKKSEILIPAFKVKALRATGAGDAWNAGNIFGGANGLSDSCRMALANAVSACYITDSKGSHPTRKELAHFLEKQKL